MGDGSATSAQEGAPSVATPKGASPPYLQHIFRQRFLLEYRFECMAWWPNIDLRQCCASCFCTMETIGTETETIHTDAAEVLPSCLASRCKTKSWGRVAAGVSRIYEYESEYVLGRYLHERYQGQIALQFSRQGFDLGWTLVYYIPWDSAMDHLILWVVSMCDILCKRVSISCPMRLSRYEEGLNVSKGVCYPLPHNNAQEI